MAKLWLTYAWVDNEDNQVDYVIQELRKQGLELELDRSQLIPGQRLWPSIDQAISNENNCDAWAIYVTENSLRSEPCLEELAYALDRALRARGTSFPIIGIFPLPIDRELIPSAIATRLYVDLREHNWAERVTAGATLASPPEATNPVTPFHFKCTEQDGLLIFEMRPRAGRWYPFVVMVRNKERDRLQSISHGPSGSPPAVAMVLGQSPVETDTGYSGLQILNPVDTMNSGFAYFRSPPSEIVFGQRGETLYRISPSALQHLRG